MNLELENPPNLPEKNKSRTTQISETVGINLHHLFTGIKIYNFFLKNWQEDFNILTKTKKINESLTA